MEEYHRKISTSNNQSISHLVSENKIMYKVSVIIPIYNVEKYIEKCASSLFKQTLESIEFIFVDDCSPDNSISILQSVLNKYPDRIPHTKIVHHDYNRGSAAARNTGRAIAQGEYIIECDSDDWVESNMYELMYQKAQQTNADIVICDLCLVYPTKKKHISINPPLNHIKCVAYLFSGKMHGSVCNKLIKKELYIKHNISCTEGMNYLEDLNVTYRLFYYAESISYIDKPLYNYFQGNTDSYTSKSISEQSQSGMLCLIKQIQDFFEKEQVTNPDLYKAFSFLKASITSEILHKGNIKNMKEFPSISISAILAHPTLTLYYKMLLICSFVRFTKGIQFMRIIYHCLKS